MVCGLGEQSYQPNCQEQESENGKEAEDDGGGHVAELFVRGSVREVPVVVGFKFF